LEYLVKAKLRVDKARELIEALESCELASGEVYEEEVQRALLEARVESGIVTWTETCYCPTPLEAERSVLEVYFEDIKTEPLAGEPSLEGVPFLEHLRSQL
jgi:hypothetical protein